MKAVRVENTESGTRARTLTVERVRLTRTETQRKDSDNLIQGPTDDEDEIQRSGHRYRTGRTVRNRQAPPTGQEPPTGDQDRQD